MKLDIYLKINRGAARRIAKQLGITAQSVYEWGRRQVPAERVLTIWKLTQKKVTPLEMRPDLYPRELIEIKKDIDDV